MDAPLPNAGAWPIPRALEGRGLDGARGRDSRRWIWRDHRSSQDWPKAEPRPVAAEGLPAVSGQAIEVQPAAPADEEKASATGEAEPESGEEKTEPGKKAK